MLSASYDPATGTLTFSGGAGSYSSPLFTQVTGTFFSAAAPGGAALIWIPAAQVKVIDGSAVQGTDMHIVLTGMSVSDHVETILTGDGDDVLEIMSRPYSGSGFHGTFIDVGAGDDIVRSWNGDDTIMLGAGNDVAWAGGGDDEIHAGSGQNLIYGGEGFDTVVVEGNMDDWVIEQLPDGNYVIREKGSDPFPWRDGFMTDEVDYDYVWVQDVEMIQFDDTELHVGGDLTVDIPVEPIGGGVFGEPLEGLGGLVLDEFLFG